MVSKQTYTLVLEAIGPVIGRALRGSPLKVAKHVEVVGKTLWELLVPKVLREKVAEKKDSPLTPARVEFAVGEVSLTAQQKLQLRLLVRHLRRGTKLELSLSHELGAQDWERLKHRANPSEDELKALLDGLDARHSELVRRRSRPRGPAESALARDDARGLSKASRELRSVDASLGDLESARDKACVLLAERSDWDTRARTRAAARALGEARLEPVAQLLRSQKRLASISGRLHLRTPGESAARGVAKGSVLVVPRLVREK